MKKHLLLLIIFLLCGFIAKAQQAGNLNAEFSNDGWDASIFASNSCEIKKNSIQPDGKILVCAEDHLSSEGSQALIIRYNTDGTVDTTFGGGDGVVRSLNDAHINLFTRAYGMTIQSNGKIIVVGDVFYNTERVFRLNTDGTLDNSFGGNGNGVVDLNRPNSEFVYHVAVQSDDKFIVCGKESRFVNGVQEPHVFLWRFTAEGVLDTSFGNLGVVSYNSNAWLGAGEAYLIINDLIVLPDDKILINQSFTDYPSSSVLLRKFNADGTSDNSFGTNGESIKTEVLNHGNYKYSSSSVQENGAIISSFTSYNNVDNTFSEKVYRVNTNGEIDPTFNLNIGNPSFFPSISNVIVSGNNWYFHKKLNSGGDLSYDQIYAFDLSGNIITTFGNNGVALLDQNSIPTSLQAKVAVASNGNMYIASTTTNQTNYENQFFLLTNIFSVNQNLSVNQQLKENLITFYPNPTTGIVTISNEDNGTIDKIEILDILGKTIATKTGNPSQVDISNLVKGIYVFKIYSGENISIKKIIKE